MQTNTRHLPVTIPRASKHSTWQNKAPGSPTALQGPHGTGRLPVDSTQQKQHSKHGSQHPQQTPTADPRQTP